MPHEDIEELKAKWICRRCVGETYLRAEMGRKGRFIACSYCDRKAKSYSIGEMAERIEEVFEAHFRRTGDQPNSWQQTLLSDRESEYEWERAGDPIVQAIANAADMPQLAAEDIQAVLDDEHASFDSDEIGEETEFSSDSYYEERDTNDRAWQEDWQQFEHSLKTEARFFSRRAHLESVFHDVERMSAPDGRPMVIDAGPGTPLHAVYRARTFQSDERLEEALCRPDRQLGSPPAHLSAAGRMNARGISVFYGANDPRVAIAEVRPPVGSRVAVARFEIIRPLKLLDLTALSAVSVRGSLFDPGLADRLERAMFLRSLSQRITRPVMPDDEAFEYLPTQAIADFLAMEGRTQIDGILFPSVQAAGTALNVVLFHKAAGVEPIAITEGTTISASTGQWSEEGWETEYAVFARQLPETEQPQAADDGWPDLPDLADATPTPSGSEISRIALRIDLESISVHEVEGVEVHTTEHHVTRHS